MLLLILFSFVVWVAMDRMGGDRLGEGGGVYEYLCYRQGDTVMKGHGQVRS